MSAETIPPDSAGSHHILDSLDKIGHKIVTVAELINILAQQSPMMPIIGYDEDKGGPRYLNGIRVDDDEGGSKPTFILYFSEFPKSNKSIWDLQTFEEKVAEQKNKALDMHEEKKRHMGSYG